MQMYIDNRFIYCRVFYIDRGGYCRRLPGMMKVNKEDLGRPVSEFRHFFDYLLKTEEKFEKTKKFEETYKIKTILDLESTLRDAFKVEGTNDLFLQYQKNYKAKEDEHKNTKNRRERRRKLFN